MPVSAEFREFVLEQLALAGVTARAMFGGYGLYAGGVIFAVLDDDVCYLRTDEAGRARFLAAGSRPFSPAPDGQPMLGYWEVPVEVLEDRFELAAWSRDAQAVGARAQAQKSAQRAAKERRGAAPAGATSTKGGSRTARDAAPTNPRRGRPPGPAKRRRAKARPR
jgi:DNA transformation protein